MIKLENITKKYNGKPVLDIYSLNIYEGKLTSIIGPNGSGKSTLLSIISNNLEPDTGMVYIDNYPIKKYSKIDFAKILSIMNQSNELDIDLTIRELVSFGRYPYSKGNLTELDNKEIDYYISYVNLTNIQNKLITEISGGEKQRAILAMLLAQNTEYILLDEPLNNLDMKSSKDLMMLLRTLVDKYCKTVIIVLHDINFAARYSDNVIIIKDGRLQYNETVDKAIREPVLNYIYDMKIKVDKNKLLCDYF